jgi:FolB domain-containing protein
MSRISIVDLEVFYHVGITDEERSRPQRLLLTIDMTADTVAAEVSDRLEKTINYYDLAQDLLHYGERRSWKLIEKLTANLADLIMVKYKPLTVNVEVKKFPIKEARYVSVALGRTQSRS